MEIGLIFLMFGLMLYLPVNIYGHVRMVSSPNYTFFPGKLDYFHARIQESFSWGTRPDSQKKSFFHIFFLIFSPQFILQFTEGVQWFYYRENYTFPRIQRGSNIFQGVPNANFYRNPYYLCLDSLSPPPDSHM